MTTPAGCPEPFARTRHGVTMWQVPGLPGHCLTWGGEYNMVRLCGSIMREDGAIIGAPVKPVSGRCMTITDWLAGDRTS